MNEIKNKGKIFHKKIKNELVKYDFSNLCLFVLLMSVIS
jgi:hypothetical protein